MSEELVLRIIKKIEHEYYSRIECRNEELSYMDIVNICQIIEQEIKRPV